jgi:ABC-type transport system substrate-binding protein
VVVLEANPTYWDKTRSPRVRRIVFDNTISQREAVEAVKGGEGRVDLVAGLSPLETLRMAQSPFGAVVKSRGTLETVFGFFNMRKPGTPWRDARMRQAVNLAINRADLIRYGTRGNGTVLPALVSAQAFGYDRSLAPYPFDPARARHLVRETGHPDGLAIELLATEDIEASTTVIGKMLEQAGFKVERRILDPAAYSRTAKLDALEGPAEQQSWDIALTSRGDIFNFAPLGLYHFFAVGGPWDWGVEHPELRRLQEQVLRTVDRKMQEGLIRQMERHAHEQAQFLFLYNPVRLYAVNRAVQFVPYATGLLSFAETTVTDQHWSVRKGAGSQ